MIESGREFTGTTRFAVQRCLGRGGFGTVYEAYDRQRQARVAIKILHRADAGGLFRLKREFRALADLSHPNLAALYELLSDDGLWFMSMELISGTNLLTFVQDGSSHEASLARLDEGLRQLARGLQYLHSAGKLHCDIKPSNVLVTNDSRLKLLDFGLVTELGAEQPIDATFELLGTPAYMAPEQLGGEYTEATDWYSVGVILFQVLTGRLPFTGGPFEVMKAKQEQDAPSPRDFAPDVPARLNDLCRGLLARNGDERLRVAEMLLNLDPALSPPLTRMARAATPAAAPFVGRLEHLDALTAAYEASKGDQAITMYVHGASGMGKTALVRQFLRSVEESDADAVVLSGRCFECESVPYKALDNLVDALSGYLRQLPEPAAEALLPRDVLALVRLFPILRRVEVIANARQRAPEIPDSQELRRRAFAAFRELMARIAAKHPLVLFIDDLQWGDADSAVLLIELMRSPDAPPLLLLAAYRTEEATSSAPLRTLLSAGDQARDRRAVRELVVGELQRSEAQTLARALMDERDRTGWTADTVAREAGGSPYLIAELASYANSREAAAGRLQDAAVETESRPGEISLDQVIKRRVHELPDAARRLLEILAVSGRPLSLSIASRAGGIGSLELDALAALRAARLSKTRVIEGREEIETYHDRIRETVVSHLEPVTLRAHHAALALALENFSGADPEALAVHFQGAGDYENAARYAIAAGDRAADALAFDNAVRLYRLGLDLQAIDAGNRQLIHVKLGDALANAGRGRDAAHAYLAAVNGATAADRLELQRRAAEQLLRSGHIDEAIVAIRAVLATMGMHLAESPQRALISMLLRRLEIRVRGLKFNERDVSQIAREALVRIDVCWSIAIGLGIVDNIRAADFQARHLLLALRTGEPFRITRALSIEVAYSAIPGGARARRRAEEIGEMAQQLADRLGNPLALGLVAISRGTAAHLLGQWRIALEHCERAEPILRERCTGVGWELAIAHLYSLLSLQYLGELRELSRRLPVLIKEARERDDLHAVTNYQTRLSYIRCLAADDPDGARKEVREGIDVWYQKTYTSQHYFELLASVEIALYDGDGPTAWGHIERHWSALKRSLLLRVQRIRIESLFIRGRSAMAASMVTSDDHQRANLLGVTRKTIRQLRRQDAPHAAAIADLLATGLGSLTPRVGRHDVAMLLENTALAFAQEEMALYAAATRRRLGEISGGARGSALVSEADAWMNAHGIENPVQMTLMLAPGQYRP
jgi:hypothetical protein